ncbi:MAG TPA: hypothetical protein VGP79_13375 [Bryobacteraceae bacterium]|nr:hypothetical protein [Bryobacteraceae bacterium]
MSARTLALGLTLLISPAAFSQATVSTNVSYTLNFTNTTEVPIPNTNNTLFSGSGTATLQPFGNATILINGLGFRNAVGGNLTITFVFPSGDSLTLAAVVATDNHGTGTFTGGTGQFSGATGSVTIDGTETGGSGSGTLIQLASAVTPAAAAPLSITFNFAGGATADATQSITLTNGSSSNKTFTASINRAGGALTISPSSGTIPPYTTLSIPVTARPTGLAVGTYTGGIAIAFGSGESFSIPVTVIVAPAAAPAVVPSGLQFAGVAGVNFSQSSTVRLLNLPAGANVSATTFAADGNTSWLSVVPGNGSAGISANARTLVAGVYYGRVEFTLPAPNVPLEVTVVFNVLAPTAPVTPTLSTTALVFFGSTLSGSVQLNNPGSTSIAVTTRVSYLVGSNWLTVTPANATIPSAGSTSFTISAVPAALQPAIQNQTIFRASVQFILPSGAIVPLEMIYLPPPPGSSAPAFSEGDRTATCVPTLIAPAFTKVPSAFAVTAGWPVPIEVVVFDNCGVPLTSGSVTAAFTSGDQPLGLLSIGDGFWSSTWQPRNVGGANVGITVTAKSLQGLVGTDRTEGKVSPNAITPVINVGGVVGAVDFAPAAPLAPGDYIAIFGTKLATGLGVSNTFPLATEIGGTVVIVGGRSLPVKFVSDGQINAILPYDLPLNSVQQVIVQQNTRYSTPESLTIGSAAPAVISADGSGKGQGVVVVAKADGTQFLNDAAHPARAGDVLVVYCVGLGAVSPPVIAGSAAPLSLTNTVNPATVTIGGVAAQPSFAGLTGGFAGLYQVNVQVPSGVAPGSAVPLVLTVDGHSSVGATISIQ